MIEDFIGKIIQGDCLEVLKTLPDESIDCMITSPPYYGLRNYGTARWEGGDENCNHIESYRKSNLEGTAKNYKEGNPLPYKEICKKCGAKRIDQQLGLEKTFDEYLDKMIVIMKEIKRVVKKEGTIWINFGDCFGGSPAGNKTISPANQGYDGVFVRKAKQRQGAKSFVGLDKFGGNIKTSTLTNPESLLNKGRAGNNKCLLMMPERFAIRCIDELGLILRNKIVWAKQVLLKKQGKTTGSVMPTSVKDRFNESYEFLYFFTKSKKYYSNLDAVRLPNQVLGITDFRENQGGFIDPAQLYRENSKYFKFNYRVRDAKRKEGQPQFKASKEEIEEYKKQTGKMGIKPNTGMEPNKIYNGKQKLLNPQDSTYRLQLNQKRKREETGEHDPIFNPLGKNLPSVWLVGSEPHNFQREVGAKVDHFATFPEALLDIPIRFGCPSDGIVLDPFFGSGTVGVVAKKLGRNYIGIELNPKYIELAEKRIKLECPPTLF